MYVMESPDGRKYHTTSRAEANQLRAHGYRVVTEDKEKTPKNKAKTPENK